MQKIRRVKSTLAIVESDDYASLKSIHRNDAGCTLSFHNKDNGSNETTVSVHCNTRRAINAEWVAESKRPPVHLLRILPDEDMTVTEMEVPTKPDEPSAQSAFLFG